ncbi:flagellar basal body rod protein [Alkaliphilus metalliredigens QYMF]|uniref:Flagellar basal body rod protein n=2 Tax=Alkaliphilus TaxID=114627 RepID=A6TK81_ALKMQ|nr:flagellar basal body rod protein [Alkaliphilus metalliredigens QYMF]
MFRGLYTATSGMQTAQRKLDVTSNNIANINTTGFKKDVVAAESFPEVLIRKINHDIRPRPFNLNSGVEVTREGEALGLSTDAGFFRVETDQGISHNREASFAPDEDGFLRTYRRDLNGEIDASRGNYLLDATGQRVQVDNGNLEVNNQGQLTFGGGATNLLYRPLGHVLGTMNSGVRIQKIETNFAQGAVAETANPLDVALNGQGFFRILTPNGEMYTRNGNFTMSNEGQLVTTEGHEVEGNAGAITFNEAQLMAAENIQITDKGEILLDGVVVDQIQIVNINNVKDLRKHGQSYYYGEEGFELELAPFEGEVLQGYLEESNINSIQEMVEMISTFRDYEANQKVVQAYDEILQKAVGEIGKL